MRVLGAEGDLLQVLEAGVGANGLEDSADVGFSRIRWGGGRRLSWRGRGRHGW